MNRQIAIYIGTEQLDMFENENVSVESSVQNVKDITKVFTDFSQSFSVPATPKNNAIFGFYFIPETEEAFDSRIKVSGRIELGTIPFKEGKFRLEGVKMEGGKPSSYNITFFGNLTKITEVLGDDTLQDLDLSAYDHDRTFINAETGFGAASGLFSGDVVYPFTSNTQLYFDSDPASAASTGGAVNIAFDVSFLPSDERGVQWTDLKPAIKVLRIIDQIETQYGITFSDDFLTSGDTFDELYLWASNGNEKISTETGDIQVLCDTRTGGTDTLFDLSDDSWTDTIQSNTGSPVLGSTQRMQMRIDITPDAGYTGITYRVFYNIDGGDLFEVTPEGGVTGASTTTATYRPEVNASVTATMRVFVKAEAAFSFTSQLTCRLQIRGLGSWTTSESDIVTGVSQIETPRLVMADNMPEIKLIEFIQGLIKAYNLVVIPTSETTFFVDTLENWYAAGTLRDISEYTDVFDYQMLRPAGNGELDFKFEDPESILIVERETLLNERYGDIDVDLTDGSGNKLDGGALEITVPFAQAVYERLTDQFTEEQTQACYLATFDRDLSQVDVKGHLFYGIYTDVDAFSSLTFGLVENSTTVREVLNYWRMSHTNDAGTDGTIFNSEFDEFTGTTITANLYTNYWEDYINDLFAKERRIFKYKVRLPATLITAIELNDKLLINGRRYLINNMSTNLTSGVVEFELLNDIY